MKYALATIIALSGTAAHADLWTWSKNKKLPANEATSAYKVPTLGLDVRVYEWTPAASPETVCIMAFGQSHPVGLQCVPKVRATASK